MTARELSWQMLALGLVECEVGLAACEGLEPANLSLTALRARGGRLSGPPAPEPNLEGEASR